MSGLLLDTHFFLWHASNHHRLPEPIRRRIETEPGSVLLSVVSAWEIAIKVGIGKLELQLPLPELLGTSQHDHGIELLPLSRDDIVSYEALGFPIPGHRDPFDRMLAVQAKLRGLTFVTADAVFAGYGLDCLAWDA
ncbi:MAG: type II toxin-antitoxin system VapC family toxin [Fimbriimonas sp.]